MARVGALCVCIDSFVFSFCKARSTVPARAVSTPGMQTVLYLHHLFSEQINCPSQCLPHYTTSSWQLAQDWDMELGLTSHMIMWPEFVTKTRRHRVGWVLFLSLLVLKTVEHMLMAITWIFKFILLSRSQQQEHKVFIECLLCVRGLSMSWS